jgi:malate dehydrogenase (oxaloacetate-decarboxylating)
MVRHVDRPIVFPLSNPTSRSEATPADLVAWTEGRALIATGSPFPPVSLREEMLPISQCNNVYVFPGLGLGVIASKAKRVTDEMVLAAAQALSACTKNRDEVPARLLPPLDQVREVTRQVALAVGAQAQRQGVAPQVATADWERLVDEAVWEPRYQPLRYQP